VKEAVRELLSFD